MSTLEDEHSMSIVANAYEAALVSLGWDTESEGPDAFAARLRQTFVAMRSLINEMRDPLPTPHATSDSFHKVTLEVSFGAIRSMDAVLADADGLAKGVGS